MIVWVLKIGIYIFLIFSIVPDQASMTNEASHNNANSYLVMDDSNHDSQKDISQYSINEPYIITTIYC